jgi:predicted GNAT family N-acyltransferase
LSPEQETSQVKLIEYGSDEYNQAAQLRYRLFYQEHQIPFASIFSPQEAQDWHMVITTPPEERVLAYGRLSQNSASEFQIYQMVVAPEYQGQGLGRRILQGLTELAIEQGAKCLVLNARVTQMHFYQKSGFETIGNIFASLMTGVPHIKMQKQLKDERLGG